MNTERDAAQGPLDGAQGPLARLIPFTLENKLVVFLLLIVAVGWGVRVAPFDWDLGAFPREPVPTDAIPDLGENQQIVFTEWMGRSPQDVEDQITYPLTSTLLGVSGIRTIRSFSFFGFSSIYVIFKEGVDFNGSRSRVLEKLNSLPAGTLPEGVQPALGPDATALGQIFWYTLEGRDESGRVSGGWGLDELRSIQDYQVRYALQSADGVSEVASVGGFVREYQVDVDPDAMRAHGVTLPQVFQSVRAANHDVGARSIEVNGVEYFVRGVGFVRDVADIEKSVVAVNQNVPLYIKDVARVTMGPALRRGALDKGGAEAVGGVVVARYGANPMATIDEVRKRIDEISPGLPAKAVVDWRRVDRDTVTAWAASQGFAAFSSPREGSLGGLELDQSAWVTWLGANRDAPRPPWLTLSKVTVVPFYDRTGLIQETLGTLNTAIFQEILVTILVVLVTVFALFKLLERDLPGAWGPRSRQGMIWLLVVAVVWVLTSDWLPLGPEKGLGINGLFVGVLLGGVLMGAHLFQKFYVPCLRWFLGHKLLFLSVPLLIIVMGLFIWQGANRLTRWMPEGLRASAPLTLLGRAFPGLGKEFMPPLDEGSYLFMPTTMPHASIGEALDVLEKQDQLIQSLPEVDQVVGKLGRADSALDPAPVSMFETVVNYHPEFAADRHGRRLRFRFTPDAEDWHRNRAGQPVPAPDGHPYKVAGRFDRDAEGQLIPDDGGAPFRLWRPALDPARNEGRSPWAGIRNPNDIWDEIVRVTQLPGTTAATKLQPIATRLVMPQTGMRAAMGVKVKGPDLDTLERVGLEIEQRLKQVPGVRADTVLADRIVGKPYLELEIDREAIARYGLSIRQVQDVIEVAIGGKRITTTVEGRERYPVRVRYPRELRNQIESLGRILVPGVDGAQIPLTQLAELRYERGPQVIKSEDTFLVGYVVFDKLPGFAEVNVVEACQAHLRQALAEGSWQLPKGVSYAFTGNYENQIRASRKLAAVVPLALLLIFLILYLQFRSVPTALLVFSGVLVAWAGGFLMIWLYAQPWFLDLSVFGVDLRALFGMKTIHLSVAVWVGFLALFGIASDDGVLMATMLDQQFAGAAPPDVEAVRERALEGAARRVRPALMTSATTILALLPVLTSTGRGSDIMVPMAIPSFGGMTVALVTLFVVPVLYGWRQERRCRRRAQEGVIKSG